ncbi:restriction endonuclease subunit S [Streptomyces humi]|uniref:restriction endonuclease subunit S n=1 Tax=Streptomyces humi TaxID=1428620 RepID=UPI00069C2DD5|nr:restriction endonuclease subunit S [Streptomyces humi]
MTLDLGLGAHSGDGRGELPGGSGGGLPEGWAWATLGELCEVNPRSFEDEPGDDDLISQVPMAAVEAETGRINASTHVRYGDLKNKSLTRFQEDDVLFAKITPCMENGKIAVARGLLDGRALGSTEFHVLRSHGAVLSEYLMHYLLQRDVRVNAEQNMSGAVGQRRVPRPYLESLEVPVPPLAEQRRIVAEIEQQINHIEAGEEALKVSFQKIDEFRKSVICSAIPDPLPDDWEEVTVGEAGKVDLGRQRHPSWHSGPEMKPYLRVANVFEDRIDTSDVKEMDFSNTEDKYTLKEGDVLLNEGQSPHLLGRPAIYHGEPEGAAFQNTLIRFRPSLRITSEWALLVFRRHMHTGRFMKESRITTNIAHLSAARLKTVEFPFPPEGTQESIVKQVRRQLEEADRMEAELRGVTKGSADLRAALLNAAFTGALVPQDPADEPASVLLDRIRAERVTAKKAPRKRAPRKPRSAPPGQEELPQ